MPCPHVIQYVGIVGNYDRRVSAGEESPSFHGRHERCPDAKEGVRPSLHGPVANLCQDFHKFLVDMLATEARFAVDVPVFLTKVGRNRCIAVIVL